MLSNAAVKVALNLAIFVPHSAQAKYSLLSISLNWSQPHFTQVCKNTPIGGIAMYNGMVSGFFNEDPVALFRIHIIGVQW